ncbi:hypothetical protein NHQ30_004372 [Ciborinia camelliae]|nr:hypothetical protein NHQ30_004372 [Ciborinia camelliae]
MKNQIFSISSTSFYRPYGLELISRSQSITKATAAKSLADKEAKPHSAAYLCESEMLRGNDEEWTTESM